MGFQPTAHESGGGDQAIPIPRVHHVASIRAIRIVDDDELDAERVKQCQVAHKIAQVRTVQHLCVQKDNKGSTAM